MVRGSLNPTFKDLTYEELVLLYIYSKGATYFNELVREVTGHPQRTSNILKILEQYGLIQSEYRRFPIPSKRGIRPGPEMRIITLTDRGKEFVEKQILPKLQSYGETGQTINGEESKP